MPIAPLPPLLPFIPDVTDIDDAVGGIDTAAGRPIGRRLANGKSSSESLKVKSTYIKCRKDTLKELVKKNSFRMTKLTIKW